MSKWISIQDRLPKDDRLKVVKGTYYGQESIKLSNYYIPSNMTSHCWGASFQSDFIVTHWYNLPKD